MDTAENLEILREAIQAVLASHLVRALRCGGQQVHQPSDLDVDGDGMVGTALDLGGKIVYEE